MQHLSPTSTPLSSLGRQSSRGSAYSSDAGGSTPASSRQLRGSILRHSSSPLGLAAAAGGAAATASAGEAGAALAFHSHHHHHHHHVAGIPGEPLSPPCAHCAASQQQQQQLAVAVQQLAQQAAAAAAAMYADTSDEEEDAGLAAGPTAAEEEAERAAEVLAAARPARGFGALHSRASSIDLEFYAPFSGHQLGAGALQQQQVRRWALACKEMSGR